MDDQPMPDVDEVVCAAAALTDHGLAATWRAAYRGEPSRLSEFTMRVAEMEMARRWLLAYATRAAAAAEPAN